MVLPMVRIIICLFLLVGAAEEAKAQTWKKFRPVGENFEVSVPGQMTNAEKKIFTDVGELHPVTWMYQDNGNKTNFLYTLSYVDYPEGTFHKDSSDFIADFFKESINAHLHDLKGSLVYQVDAPYYSYAGVSYRASYNKNKTVVKSRMIIAGDRFYALQVYAKTENSLDPDMDRYLNSFDIIRQTKNDK